MADQNFNIDINLRTQKSGGDPAQELKKVAAATTDLKKTVVEETVATDASTKATDKAFTSKKQLKDGVRGLAMEFPILGRLMGMALNPITLVVAGIAGAFAIWRTRVDELTRSLGGIPTSDVTEEATERIKRHAEAWKGLAENIGSAATQSTGLKEHFNQVEKLIALYDKMGMLKPGQADADRATMLRDQADQMEANARAVLAKAGTPGSASAEAGILSVSDARAQAAATEMKSIRERRSQIVDMMGDFQSNSLFARARGFARLGRHYWRYGASGVANPEGSYDLESQNLASQQVFLDQNAAFRNQASARAGDRSAIAAANADLATAAGLRDRAGDASSSGAVAAFNTAATVLGKAVDTGALQSIPAAMNAFLDAHERLKKEVERLHRRVNTQSQRE